MLRWLTIYSDRMIDPVFRTFQAELENVFEEYNMYANEPSSQVNEQLMKDVYKGSPYEREVIGLPEHLKNPRLSKLIEFYNTWYVPNNMALILVGDFNTEAAKPMIAQTFSRLTPKELPARQSYPEVQLTGKKHYKLGYNPQIVWAYPGVKASDEDLVPLEFVCELLYNGQTGLLDKLNIDGEVQFAGVFCDARRTTGRVIIEAVPYYDANQQQFESDAKTEKIIMKEVDKIKNGEITDKMIEQLKQAEMRSFKVAMESGSAKMSNLMNSFVYEMPYDYMFTYHERFQALTKDEIVRVAKKYFSADHMTLSFDEGDNSQNNKTLPKPNIKPLDPVKNAKTAYAEEFKKLPKGELKQTFNDFNDVKVSSLGQNVSFYYTPNTKNNIFSMTLRYGVGEHKMPLLPYVATMMNNAGIQGDPSAKQGKDFTQQMAELGASISYACDDSYFYISISGEDENMQKIMNLVSRQVLMPSLEQKQLDNVKGSVFFSRLSRQKRTAVQKKALVSYGLYGKKSPYLDEVSFSDIWGLTLPKIQSLVAQARTYALDVFYCGTLPANDVAD
jgi:predicted Zn-dependent peptidase